MSIATALIQKVASELTLKPANVHAVKVSVQDVSASVQATGSFAAQESSNVAPDSPGVILQTMVDVGDQVKKGQVIARLDDRDAKILLVREQRERRIEERLLSPGARDHLRLAILDAVVHVVTRTDRALQVTDAADRGVLRESLIDRQMRRRNDRVRSCKVWLAGP